MTDIIMESLRALKNMKEDVTLEEAPEALNDRTALQKSDDNLKVVDDSFDFENMKIGEKVRFEDITIAHTKGGFESVSKSGVKSIYAEKDASEAISDAESIGGNWFDEAVDNGYFNAGDIDYIDYRKDPTRDTFYIAFKDGAPLKSGYYSYMRGRLYPEDDFILED